MKIRIKKLNEAAAMPTRGTQAAAGFDLYATEETELLYGQPTKVPTGLAFEIPEGYVGVVYSRSSSAKNGIVITPLLVDADYRGEVFVLASLVQHYQISDGGVCYMGKQDQYVVHKGDRIAQIRIEKLIDTEYEWADELTETARGTGGYGSTGR